MNNNIKKIFINMGTLITLIVGIFGYFFLSYNYTEGNVCDVSGRFRCISLIYCLAIALICFGIKKEKELYRVTNPFARLAFFLLTPLITLVIEEITWNIEFQSMNMKCVQINYLIILVLCFCLFLIVRNERIVYCCISSVGVLYGLVNYFVLLFKGCPPVFSDFLAISTAATVMDNYEYIISDSVTYGILIYLYYIVLLIYFPPGRKKEVSYKRKYLNFAISFGVSIAILWIARQVQIADVTGITIYAWNPVISFRSHGAPLTFAESVQNTSVSKPKNYSVEEVESMMASLEQEPRKQEVIPSVIVIMNESFADMKGVGEFDSEEYLSYWNSTENYIYKGNTYVSVIGGGTCNSEFEFLTGSSMANIKPGVYPYEDYQLDKAYSMPTIFKDYGYETAALHPYVAKNWNRPKVYEDFGFDNYYDIDDMTDLSYILRTASDQCNYKKVIEIYENRSAPLFMFNVTMQNHGGYEGALASGVVPVEIEEQYARYGDVVNYLTLVRESDKAFQELIEYFAAEDSPVIICMFGDHQPALDGEFIASIQDDLGEEVANKETRYVTPYLIWANYDMGIQPQEKDISLNYLGALLMKAAGVETEYSNYLLKLSEDIPIVNAAGYQTSDGAWHKPEEFNEKLEEYKNVQYYELFEVKDNEKDKISEK